MTKEEMQKLADWYAKSAVELFEASYESTDEKLGKEALEVGCMSVKASEFLALMAVRD